MVYHMWPIKPRLPRKPCSFASAVIVSLLRCAEATNVEKIVTHFLKGGILPQQIGVITPYEGQRAHVVTTMQRVGTLRQVNCSHPEAR